MISIFIRFIFFWIFLSFPQISRFCLEPEKFSSSMCTRTVQRVNVNTRIPSFYEDHM